MKPLSANLLFFFLDLSDSQTDTPTSSDEPTSSANILNSSNNQNEKVKVLDEEPVDKQEPDINLLHKDSQPSAESTLCEEKEMSLNTDHEPSNT